jgi:hypothetical protein
MCCGRIKGSGIVIDGSICIGCRLFLPLLALAIVDAAVALVVRLIRVVSTDYNGVRNLGALRVGGHGDWVMGNGWRGGGEVQSCLVSGRCLVLELWDYRVLDGALDGNGSRRNGI